MSRQIAEEELQPAEEHDERTHDEGQGGEVPPGLAQLDDGRFDGVLIALADRLDEPPDLLADSLMEHLRPRAATGLIATGGRFAEYGVIIVCHGSPLCQLKSPL